MTVGELKEILDNYGDHLDVTVLDSTERSREIDSVEDVSTPNGVHVEICTGGLIDPNKL